ncbi:hypothetical protein AQUCO_01600418v1 [Aquilegia coerulea]|uniref:Uncharacterized protein n=1 Tax=Aquilegia coerulea TaxID=218851 RepID=A0A2G5DRI9_AQUCA|nr:hypothetical protein AQUCO_01600418v1 [Aquilegia coerulea]
MNHRISKDNNVLHAAGSYSQQHRRGRSLSTGGGGGGAIIISTLEENNLDLFSRNRRTLNTCHSDDHDHDDDLHTYSPDDDDDDVSMKLGRVSNSIGSLKLTKNGYGMDDLLTSVDAAGKNDYDWLLTPPGTPLFSEATEPQNNVAPSRNNSSVRSAATTKTSRLSVTQSENSYSSRPTRSSSVTRSSIPSINYNTYSSNSTRSSTFLNTSSGSVTSISRPSTPHARSTLTSRPSTPTSRTPSRPATPVKSRPTPSSSFGEKSRAPQSHPRPSTPSSRPQTPTNVNSPALRSSSRPATPTRRNTTPGPQLVTGHSASTGRAIANGRASAPASRGCSPGPRVRPPPQPVVPPDFPLDTPPNLRTTMPERPVSAGRSRPSGALSVRGGNSEPGLTNPPRRQSSSPIVTRGRLPDLGKGRLHSNGHNINAMETQKTPPVLDPATRRPTKSATSTESTGFGRTISKKSLDMALRHMDIRLGSGNIRPSPGSTVFPQSIRPGTGNGHSARVADVPVSVSSNGGTPTINNLTILDNGNCNISSHDGEFEANNGRFSARLSSLDIYESSRYDAILLKEDSKNTNWLTVDDKSDQGFMYDHRFDLLPEPFDPL